MVAFDFICDRMLASLFCAAGFKFDAPVAKITFMDCCPFTSGRRDATSTVFGAVSTAVNLRDLGGAALANEGGGGG